MTTLDLAAKLDAVTRVCERLGVALVVMTTMFVAAITGRFVSSWLGLCVVVAVVLLGSWQYYRLWHWLGRQPCAVEQPYSLSLGGWWCCECYARTGAGKKLPLKTTHCPDCGHACCAVADS